jgi:RNA polymerase sigma-70 factor (ECF subfamily)
VVRDLLRKEARSKAAHRNHSPYPHPPVILHEDRIDLELSIQQLPDGCRLVLVLHDVEGMKHAEIAEKLGIATGTSKSQLSNARKMLRSMLSKSREIDHDR